VSDPLDDLRAVPAALPPAPSALVGYLQRVHECAYKVTDGEVDALKSAGLSDDEIFEQTVAVAISEGLRRLDAATEVIG
jgi:alkylhydroperoxidase family enzyme